MELRSPENDERTSVPSSYGHRSSAGERRKDGNHNGTTVIAYSQTLDQQNRPVSNTKTTNVRYRECLRNHAATVGGNVFDGCGEFMPGGDEGKLEALRCAACECHRNFHRKEVDGETQFSPSSRRSSMIHSLQLPPPLPSPTMLHHQRYPVGLHARANMVQPMSVAFGGGNESSSEDLNPFQSNAEGVLPPPPPPSYGFSKKRFRTKFTPNQKDRMLEFAEKVGWRIDKKDEEEVERFCAEVGVRRQVFKVWMHNNKNSKSSSRINHCFEEQNLIDSSKDEDLLDETENRNLTALEVD